MAMDHSEGKEEVTMLQSKSQYHVYITSNTYRGMLLEAGRHPGLESIIQMPGLRVGNNFYFDMVADSGIDATYTPTMVEKDHQYADHLATRLCEYYDLAKGRLTVSQVHRHPDGCLRFSPGDHSPNSKLARQYGGVVNGLIFIDPQFRLKFWYIDENGDETEAPYEINDEAVRAAMPYVDLDRIKRNVEQNEAAHKPTHNTAHMTVEENKMKRSILTRLSQLFTEARGGENTEAACAEIDFEALQEARRPYTVLLPAEYRADRYEGQLVGYYHESTKTYNIVRKALGDARSDVTALGEAIRDEHPDVNVENLMQETDLFVIWDGDKAEVRIRENAEAEVHVDYYHSRQDIFSRNQGIVAQDWMAGRQAIIAGVGSGGFKVGLELVRAGIGSLIVSDNDILGYHNVCRHECGIHDVGRYKVDCFRERAADINPECKVYAFQELIQHVDPAELENLVWKNSIILCCADNRHCGYVCNQLADQLNIPMICAGCGPRASTGEVFWYKPNSGMACYTCAFGEDKGVDYANQAVRRRFYATETELEKLHFQPGMYLDIQLTALFEARLAIDLLMENEEDYEPKLLPYINQCTVLLNYTVDQDVNPYMHLFGTEDQRRPLTWKTMPAQRNGSCSYCGEEHK